MMTVIVGKPGQAPEVQQIENTLEGMQAVVEGPIQRVWMGPFEVYFNEEGRLQGLPFNGIVAGYDILGTFFVCKPNEEESQGLTESEITKVLKLLKASR